MDHQTVWLTSTDVAEEMGVHVKTVHRWIKKGDLPAMWLGGRTGYRITQEALDSFKLSRTVRKTAIDELAGKNER